MAQMEKDLTLEELETQIGELRVLALETGGEPLLDMAEQTLGVARRHIYRVQVGALRLVPAVVKEIQRSFNDTKQLIAKHATDPTA